MNFSLLNRIISHLLNYLFLAYVLIWFPLVRTTLVSVDGAGNIGLLIALLSLGVNLNNSAFQRLFYLDKSILIWGCWCLYVSIAWSIIGMNDTGASPLTFLWVSVFMAFYSMIVSSYETMHNAKRITLLLVCFLIIYQLLGTYFELKTGVIDEERRIFIIGNNLSLSGCALVYIACFRNMNKWLNTKWLIGIIALAAVSIFLLSTRKAFVGLFIILFFWLISKYKLLTLRRTPLLLLAFYVIYKIVLYVIENTEIGQRFLLLEEENRFNTTDYGWLNILGDRAYYYIEGWKLFLEYPVFGIGLRNFKAVVEGDYVIHSEYMVQLCECGIVGTVLFIMFYFSLFRRIWVTRRAAKWMFYSFISWMVFMLFMDITAWTYQFSAYFVCFGIIIGVTKTANLRKVSFF